MNQQNNLLIWDKKFELGIPAIDAQHEHLVELCNNLYQSIIRQKDAGGLSGERLFAHGLCGWR